METTDLQRRILELENENRYLKSLLDQVGISYASLPSALPDDDIFTSDQGNRIIHVEITRNHARKFFSYFWGRMDVFSKRYQNKNSGKTGYFPQCDNFWRQGICPKASGNRIKCRDCQNRAWTKLEAPTIEAHLRGNREDGSDVIGVYPLFPDGTCRFMVFDFDNHEKGAEEHDYANSNNLWKDEVNSVREICKLNGIPALVERSRSGRGAHIWIFFDAPISASLIRRFGFALLEKGAELVNLKSFRYYDRMLPAQSELDIDGLGNLIALPLQGHALQAGNSAFIDDNWNAFPDQWKALLSTERLNQQKLEQLISDWNISESGSSSEIFTNDKTNPWERTSEFAAEDIAGELQITLGNQIYINTQNLKPRIQNQIRRLAAISNPLFFKNNAIGLSNYAQSRFIYLGEDSNGYICIPRGLLNTLKEHCHKSKIKIHIEDKRSCGHSIHVSFIGELRENQKKAISELLPFDTGILSAATAFGKTVTCSGIIAEKKISTLILLESSALVEQWEKSLSKFLSIREELPEYHTKTGRTKKRKILIGIIQGSKDTSTGIIDIAMAGSLFKKGEPHPRLREYGMVIVDECHHSASNTLSAVLKEITAKYVYGVTATPFRGDGLEKINYMLLGPIRYQYSAKEKAAEQGIPHLVIPRFTRVVSPHGRENLHVNDAYELIRDSAVRNEQILADIKQCVLIGRTPVVLTRYTEHAAKLYEQAKEYADKVFLLTGTKSKKEQKELREEMDFVTASESVLLIATGQLIGEGFDYPRLDTLIMATPVAWKGIVEQYAGRLNRDYKGKKSVLIYDYVDSHIPVFDKMYSKRLSAYKRIGYKISIDGSIEKQESNSIFDADTYTAVYEKDLMEANTDILISSPTIGKQKVFRLINLLKQKQEAGVKVTIVTWHPDAYRYGRDEHRIELMECLRNAGFYIELLKDHCEHYAVIDNKIVWYGSMNLLSKDDLEDNIMRVVDKDIAAELLEMTFQKGNHLHSYQLPI